jgi:hypothetical protein
MANASVSSSASKGASTASPVCGWRHEKAARRQGALRIAGLDEVGRGPLFGPVVAAAVILAPRCRLDGLTDSKKLSEKKRDEFAVQIRANAVAWAVAAVDVETIDRINIRRASLLAMRLAVEQLALSPDYLLIDGVDTIDWPCPQQSVIQGDWNQPVDCGGKRAGQGASRPHDGGVRWPVSRLRAGQPQGLRGAGASGGACQAGTDAAAPQELRPGGADASTV